MIVIKQIVNGNIESHITYRKGVINLRKAIYWLKALRKETVNYHRLDTAVTCWLEIDNLRIPDSHLLLIDSTQQGNYLLNSLHDKPITD